MSDRHVINLSTAWLPPDSAAGRRDWLRRFGMPSGVAPGDLVWLVVESPGGCDLSLAGKPLPTVEAGSRCRHEVSGLLRARNELALVPARDVATAACPAAHGRVPLPEAVGRVRLEIEPGGSRAGQRSPA